MDVSTWKFFPFLNTADNHFQLIEFARVNGGKFHSQWLMLFMRIFTWWASRLEFHSYPCNSINIIQFHHSVGIQRIYPRLVFWQLRKLFMETQFPSIFCRRHFITRVGFNRSEKIPLNIGESATCRSSPSDCHCLDFTSDQIHWEHLRAWIYREEFLVSLFFYFSSVFIIRSGEEIPEQAL